MRENKKLIGDLWEAALKESPDYQAELTLYGLAAAALEQAQRAEGAPRMEVLREKIGQAAYEWQQYVDTDHAPRNLVDHMEAAFDAATKGPNGG